MWPQHVEDRDALVSRIAHVTQRKQLLQSTNVYNDAFKIWCVQAMCEQACSTAAAQASGAIPSLC
jgi:hypothetical protein